MIYNSQFTGAEIDARLAAVTAMQTAIGNLETALAAKYSKPDAGIPETDLDADVQAALALARTAVQSLSDYYTKAQVDAIAESIAAAVNATSGVVAATLPAASADTLGKIYYVGPTSGEYARYVTSYDGTTYSWLSIGTTDVDMTQYATKAEVSQLDQEITIQSVSPASSTYNRIIQAADGVIAAPSPANQNTNVVTFPVLPNHDTYKRYSSRYVDEGRIE